MNFVTTITGRIAIAATMILLLTCIAFAGGTPGSGEKIDGIPEGFKIIEGDIIVPIDFEQQMTLGCVYNQLWTNGVVPYEFDTNVNPTNQARALQAMSNWEEVSGVDFVPLDTHTNYIHIQSSTGNSSYVGCIGGEQVVNIYNWSYEFIIAHELGHALGLWHEQSREDRGSYVWINWTNMDSVDMHNFEIHSPSSTFPGEVFGPYDFNSVMHYSDDAFSKNGDPTIDVFPPFRYWQNEIGQRDGLSAVDMLTMTNLYPDPAPSGYTGHKWDPNYDNILLTVADLVCMTNGLLSDPGFISWNNYSWEYDGYKNPSFPCQPTFGDLLQFALYFSNGNENTLLTVKNPIWPSSQSDLQVTLPAQVVLNNIGSSTYTIRLTNTGPDDMYLWMVTIPIELPKVTPSHGTISYTWYNELSAGGCNTSIHLVTNGTPDHLKRYCILFMHELYGNNPDPGILLPGESIILCNLQIDWDLNWGAPVSFDLFESAPALVPVTATSKTPARVVSKSSSCALPVITQSVWNLYYEGSYVDGDADGSGNVDIDDVVFSIEYIFAGGQAPVPYEAGDADCSGMVDIDDAVYLINYIFAGGPPPENCSGGPAPTKMIVGSAAVAVIDNTDAGDSFTLSLDADREVQAVQFEFTIFGDVSGLEARSLVDGVDVFFGEKNGVFKVGLIDIYGQNMIPAGGIDIVSISYEGDGKLELVNSIAVARGGGRLETRFDRQTTDGMIPTSFTLNQNYPNPFNPMTEISFSLPKTSRTTLTVYNIMGQSVSTLIDDVLQAGDHSVTWYGTTDGGESVSSGIYFYRISAGDYTDARKMVLMK